MEKKNIFNIAHKHIFHAETTYSSSPLSLIRLLVIL